MRVDEKAIFMRRVEFASPRQRWHASCISQQGTPGCSSQQASARTAKDGYPWSKSRRRRSKERSRKTGSKEIKNETRTKQIQQYSHFRAEPDVGRSLYVFKVELAVS